jgi:DNA (cytosine-5)-methyltransferase 1
MKKVLNLYAGIGGNRRGWGNDYDVTAVEYDPLIAEVYAENFPNDTVIVGDALQYLLDHYQDFDFIWASPPCPTHSQYRFNVGVRAKGYDPVIPEMTSLYGIVTFLEYHFDGGWAVENVKPYYEPLITPTAKVGRHLVWSSFPIENLKIITNGMRKNNKISQAQAANGFDISHTKIKNKRQVLRNCTESEVGSHVIKAWEVTA